MKPIQHIMEKNLIKKRTFITIFVLFTTFLSGCVTQNYENDDTPVVKNQANRDDMAATRVSLGLGYLKMGNMPQAKKNLEKAKNFAPDMVQVYTAFAHYYETVGEHKLTVESYEKALSIKEDDADTLNNYGVYLCRQDQIEAAEKQFLKAIAVPTYILVAKSYENLSSCFLQQDDFIKAEMYLNKAILHSPSSSSTLFQMIQLQYAIGDYKQASLFKQRFEKYTRRFTSQSLALSYKVHYMLGERSTAKNYGAMLVKMYPQSWESQQYLLNELELIEADNLAKRYQLSQVDNPAVKSKKRIVKLSPRKTKSVQKSPEIESKIPNDIISEPKELITKVDSSISESTYPVDKAQTTLVLHSSSENLNTIVESSSESNEEKTSVITGEPIDDDKSALLTKKMPKNSKKSPDVIEEQLDITKNEEESTKKFLDFHVVESGDTLYSISLKYNVKIEMLLLWNNIEKNKKLHIKDIIFLEDPKVGKSVDE